MGSKTVAEFYALAQAMIASEGSFVSRRILHRLEQGEITVHDAATKLATFSYPRPSAPPNEPGQGRPGNRTVARIEFIFTPPS
jgi:hypothetical protein